jgi:hypothetical protein
MPSYAAVTRDAHAGKALLPRSGYGFAAGEAVVPLVGAELPRAALAMPIVFLGTEAPLRPMALLSFLPGRNQFVAPDGQWLGSYVPAALRSYPFALVRPEGAEHGILCVEEESGLVVAAGTAGADPFFGPDGEPAAAVRQALDFLAHVERNQAATDRATAALAASGVIVPWPLEVETTDGRKSVQGLFKVDEARLNALDDETFLGLRRSGALTVAYAQLLSMGQVSIFQSLAQLQAQLGQIHAQQRQTIEKSFIASPAETLGFTWDNL